jgi:hypothetical protein
LQNAFHQNSRVYRDLLRISDNRDYRDNHDYHSSEILSDNREVAITALAKKVAIIAIITSDKKRYSYFAKKLKMTFRINPSFHNWFLFTTRHFRFTNFLTQLLFCFAFEIL